jgi:hypothetical protein
MADNKAIPKSHKKYTKTKQLTRRKTMTNLTNKVNPATKTIEATFSAKELDKLTEAITCYQREIEDDLLMYKNFISADSPNEKDHLKRINELQTDYFDLVALWKKCASLERQALKTEADE